MNTTIKAANSDKGNEMRIALCSQDNVAYTVEEFALAEDFRTKRRFLLCTECRGQAFYRRPTRNGREACFGASHANGCTLATVDPDGVRAGQGGEEDEVLTTGQRIVVDFNYGTVGNGETTAGQGVPIATGPVRADNDHGPALRDEMRRRISSILRSLIESEEFRNRDQIVEIEGIDYTIADFFVNFADAGEQHVGSLHGFWGMVSDARTDRNGTVWFNSGGREDVSAFLDQRYIQEVRERFGWDDEEDVAGAYILVFGMLRRARNGKMCVEINDPGRFTLRLT